MKKLNFFRVIIALALMLTGTLPSFAHDFEVDGIYYNHLYGNNVEVTYKGSTLSEYANEYSGSITIPSSVIINGTTYSVIYIDDNAFYGCTGLTSVTIPNSVTSIGSNAFYGCTSLTEVNISDLSAWCKISFGDNPLYYARHLKLNGTEITNLVIPDDITEIKAYAFAYCTGLKEVTIPNSVSEINNYAFYGCTGLTSVTIGNSVTSIGAYAFDGCSGLTEVNISDISTWCKIDFANEYANPLHYASHLKLNGTEITNLVIPDDITEIKAYAFDGCIGLTSVTIPNSVTEINNYAFDNCSNLAELIIEDGKETLSLGFNYFNSNYGVGQGLFSNCSLEKLYLGRNLDYDTRSYYGYSPFYKKSTLKKITIGNSVTTIGAYAFSYCTGLTSITIPNSVTVIGYGAFDNCI